MFFEGFHVGSVTLSNVQVTNSGSTSSAGGVLNAHGHGVGIITLQDSVFTNNIADQGGVVYTSG